MNEMNDDMFENSVFYGLSFKFRFISLEKFFIEPVAASAKKLHWLVN